MSALGLTIVRMLKKYLAAVQQLLLGTRDDIEALALDTFR
jgi:hypothetical protein